MNRDLKQGHFIFQIGAKPARRLLLKEVFIMVKLECILRPEKFEPVREALSKFGVKGMTVTQVMGCGLQKGHTQYYRGTELSVSLLPKMKLEIVTTDDRVEEIIKVVRSVGVTGNIGDGKIFVAPIKNAIRMRTGETGDDALG